MEVNIAEHYHPSSRTQARRMSAQLVLATFSVWVFTTYSSVTREKALRRGTSAGAAGAYLTRVYVFLFSSFAVMDPAPVQKAPDEILTMFLCLALAAGHPWWRLSHVCRSWRRIVREQPNKFLRRVTWKGNIARFEDELSVWTNRKYVSGLDVVMNGDKFWSQD